AVLKAGGAYLPLDPSLPAAGTHSPTDLLGYLAKEQVTIVDLTPAYWHQLLAITEPDDERLRSVRLMITGGEAAVPVDICASAIQHISAHAEAPGRTYHIASEKHALLGFLVDRLRHRGFGIRQIPYDEWVDELLKTPQETLTTR